MPARPTAIPRLSLLALLAIAVAGCSSQAHPPEPVRPAIVAQPATADAAAARYFSGDVRARHESQLGFRVAGKIERRLVEVGERVDAGQVLARLDPADLRLQLAAANAAATSADAELALAQAERDRFAALLERRLVSASQFQAQETALAAAQARREQARAQRAVSGNQVEYTELRADRAGIVTAISAETGQVVAAGQVIAQLAQAGEREIEIALPEAQHAQFRPGQAAQVALWSTPGVVHAGVLREVAPDADPASRTYRARVTLSGDASDVALGQTARVRFDQGSAAGQLSLPLAALDRQGDQAAVWRLDPANGQVARVPVTVARYTEDVVLLADGIGADDWLVVAGVHQLHDGQVVRPIDRDNRPLSLR